MYSQCAIQFLLAQEENAPESFLYTCKEMSIVRVFRYYIVGRAAKPENEPLGLLEHVVRPVGSFQINGKDATHPDKKKIPTKLLLCKSTFT